MSANGESKRAAVHNRVRQQHSDELAEDYVEAIEQLIERTGKARITDLQGIFGVSHVSVIRAMKRLEDRGLVRRIPRKGFGLTEEGLTMARESAKRHELVVKFLKKLGVSNRRSEEDAEGLEHHLSEETLRAMRRFIAERD